MIFRQFLHQDPVGAHVGATYLLHESAGPGTRLASPTVSRSRGAMWSSRCRTRLATRLNTSRWPGAFAGSVCGRTLSGKPVSTIGFERLFNRTFRIEDRDTFVAAMLRDIPEPPANAAAIRARNLAG